MATFAEIITELRGEKSDRKLLMMWEFRAQALNITKKANANPILRYWLNLQIISVSPPIIFSVVQM